MYTYICVYVYFDNISFILLNGNGKQGWLGMTKYNIIRIDNYIYCVYVYEQWIKLLTKKLIW